VTGPPEKPGSRSPARIAIAGRSARAPNASVGPAGVAAQALPAKAETRTARAKSARRTGRQ